MRARGLPPPLFLRARVRPRLSDDDAPAALGQVHKALASVGIHQLFLNPRMEPKTPEIPLGGKANLQRILTEIEALEGLLVRYRS